MDVNNGEKDEEEERTHEAKPEYRLGGALSDVTEREEKMDESPAHKADLEMSRLINFGV